QKRSQLARAQPEIVRQLQRSLDPLGDRECKSTPCEYLAGTSMTQAHRGCALAGPIRRGRTVSGQSGHVTIKAILRQHRKLHRRDNYHALAGQLLRNQLDKYDASGGCLARHAASELTHFTTRVVARARSPFSRELSQLPTVTALGR